MKTPRTLVSAKQYLVLKKIEENGKTYLSQLMRDLSGHIVWIHLVTLVNMMEKQGILKTEKKGRVRFIELTDKGRELLRHLDKIVELLGYNIGK